MSLRPRTVCCDTKGCSAFYTESRYGEGLPNWGQLRGASNDKGEEPWFCPKCMEKHLKLLNGDE